MGAITEAESLEDTDVPKHVRMLDVGESFEVLEGPRISAPAQVERVRGRAVRDGAVGWVTVTGNKGTPFLQATEKPHMNFDWDADIREGAHDTPNMLVESSIKRRKTE